MDIFGDRATLISNIDEIIRASKNEEKKKSSSQIGLFDVGLGGDDYDDSLVLKEAKPFSYEKKLF